MGRLFLERPVGSVEASNGVDKLRDAARSARQGCRTARIRAAALFAALCERPGRLILPARRSATHRQLVVGLSNRCGGVNACMANGGYVAWAERSEARGRQASGAAAHPAERQGVACATTRIRRRAREDGSCRPLVVPRASLRSAQATRCACCFAYTMASYFDA